MTDHLVIPDTQVTPSSPTKHLAALGNYIVEHRPEVIIQIGDWADMKSLCSYDKGTKGFDSRSYKEDIEASKEAMHVLFAPVNKLIAKQKKAHKEVYRPKKILTLGNHEHRITTALTKDFSRLTGLIGLENLEYKKFGWEVVPFLEYKVVDGVTYTHYVMNDFSGTAKASMKASVEKVLGSVTCGHKQILDIHTQPNPKTKKTVWGIQAGAFYTHNEAYKEAQGNIHWRGVIHKHSVKDGDFNPLFVSLDFLLNNYS